LHCIHDIFPLQNQHSKTTCFAINIPVELTNSTVVNKTVADGGGFKEKKGEHRLQHNFWFFSPSFGSDNVEKNNNCVLQPIIGERQHN